MIPEFGNRHDGIDYLDRPSAYAVIETPDRRIAVIQTGNGYFLPGGGIHPGEAAAAALMREVVEETGYQVALLVEIGAAVEWMQAAREEKYYQLRSTFYRAQLGTKIGAGIEKDHRLVWLPREVALRLLTRQSQVWAIRKGDERES